MHPQPSFHWERHPSAEALITAFAEKAEQANQAIAMLQEALRTRTSTRLFDWIDHIVVDNTEDWQHELVRTGYVLQEEDQDAKVYVHRGAQLPRVVLRQSIEESIGLAIIVDQIADFLMTHGGPAADVQGALFGGYRRCLLKAEQGIALWIVERRGGLTLEPTRESPEQLLTYHIALDEWQRRPRALADEDTAMQLTLDLARALVARVGQSRAAWTVLEGERRYWQARNAAGQIQKNRQDRLGMGWANHDHHTFRSSRRHFHQLVQLFEILGFHCRERFYAGQEAGWGAQVMENPLCRLVLFLDVDLSPEEIAGDIAHEPLPEREQLGTIGLWCALHGDSILQSGMHHLEAQFEFDVLEQDLAQKGIHMMSPFSNFSYLKQAFTAGEQWPADPARVKALREKGLITPEQAEKFLTQGAIGSHLENLQRREGYKGFNQKNVSTIIKKTDPRYVESA